MQDCSFPGAPPLPRTGTLFRPRCSPRTGAFFAKLDHALAERGVIGAGTAAASLRRRELNPLGSLLGARGCRLLGSWLRLGFGRALPPGPLGGVACSSLFSWG